MKNCDRRFTIATAIAALVATALAVVPATPVHAIEGAFDAFFLATEGDDQEVVDFFDELDSDGTLFFSVGQLRVLSLFGSLSLLLQGDPLMDYTLTVTNMTDEPATLVYGFNLDIVPLPPGSADWQMRATLQYGVEDSGGDGNAMLTPDSFAGLQQAVLSDDRTNVVSDQSLFLGFDELIAPGQAPPSDTGWLPLLEVPPLPPGVTIDTYGVMGVRGSFELSAGDTAVINGRFEIVPEPAPIALALLGAFAWSWRPSSGRQRWNPSSCS